MNKNVLTKTLTTSFVFIAFGFAHIGYAESISATHIKNISEQNSATEHDPDFYRMLSSGDKKIADALYKAQFSEEEELLNIFISAEKKWSQIEIASTNHKLNSWGKVFNQMKSAGLIKDENLGQVLRNHGELSRHENTERKDFTYVTVAKKKAIAITNANGEYMVINRTFTKGPDQL